MTFSYYIAFKLIDRGILEYGGSLAISKNLYSMAKILQLYEFGSLYSYAFIGIVTVLALILTFI